MSLPLVFHPEVQDETDEAFQWYEEQRPGLGDDFLAALDAVFQRLAQAPQIHQIIWGDIRRALPKRFPYVIFYRLQTDRVEIIAVQHSPRDPSGWQSRV